MREVRLRYFAIAFLPISILWIHSTIIGSLLATDLGVPVTVIDDARPWLETAGRLRFLAATWFFMALALLALASVLRDLSEPLTGRTRLAAAATLLLILGLASMPIFEHAADPDGPRIWHRLGADLFRSALSHGSLPGCDGPDDRWLLGRCGAVPMISLLDRMLDLINVFAGLGVGALIVGMILCLETPPVTDRDAEAGQLSRCLKRMRRQLYLSSLILTFGMFFAASWMYWPLPMIAASEREAFGALVLSSALFTGTYFCLLILSFYLPVALLLEARVSALADRAGAASGTTVEAWLETHGLQRSTSDHLRAGFAITAPILAAFAGGIAPIAV